MPRDAHAEALAPTGSMALYGTSCIPSAPAEPAGAAPALLALGSTSLFNLRASRSGAPVLFMFGEARTELPLAGLGAPGCTLYTNIAGMLGSVMFPVPGVPAGYATAELPLPLVPGLAGAHVYAQWLVVDIGANRLGLTPSNGIDITLGQKHNLGAAWIESFDLAANAGLVRHDQMPVLRLTFE